MNLPLDRSLAINCNVPVSKGSKNLPTAEICKEFIVKNEMTFPIVVKAANGGGGRGMRVVKNLSEVTKRREKTLLGPSSQP